MVDALPILVGGALLAVAVVASVIAGRLRVPGLLPTLLTARTLEGEAGFNDPIAVLLVLSLILCDSARPLRQ